MNRRTLLAGFLALPVMSRLSLADARDAAIRLTPLDVPHSFWQDKVSAQAFEVLFEEATERPHSSPLDKIYDAGTYVCAACYLPLFNSADKFDSGTGWPSFTQPIEGHMGTKQDFKMIWPRTEYHCGRCGGHQGHVFKDGPAPTGERWCNNGVALRFIAENETLPELRG